MRCACGGFAANRTLLFAVVLALGTPLDIALLLPHEKMWLQFVFVVGGGEEGLRGGSWGGVNV